MLKERSDSLQLEFDFTWGDAPVKLSSVKPSPILPSSMGKDYAYSPLFNRYRLSAYSGYAETKLADIPERHANAILKILYDYKGYSAKPNLHRIFIDYIATGWIPTITLRAYLARISYKVRCIQTDEFRTALVRESPMTRALTFQQREALKQVRKRHIDAEAWDNLLNSANKSAEDIRALALASQDLTTAPFIGDADIAAKAYHGSTEFYIDELRDAIDSLFKQGSITSRQRAAFLTILDQFTEGNVRIEHSEIAKKLGVTSARVSQLVKKLQSVLRTIDSPTEKDSTIFW